MKKLIFITIIFITYSLSSFAENPHFIDYIKILNTSKPGADVQKKLQSKFKSESQKFTKLESDIRKEESEIISQKKALSPEEYKKKVQALRKKVAEMQKNKQTSFNNIAVSKNKAKQELEKVVRPIIKKYMEDNSIRVVLNKQGVVMGDQTLEITNQIIAILNKESPSIKIN
jgi:Skp family chaperone for outer membrane proteins